MYINNINPSIFFDAPLKLKLEEGSIILGKVIYSEDLKGAIKLYDGTIIPAIFLSENNFEYNGFIKFKIESFKEGLLTLSCIEPFENQHNDSIATISSRLFIPKEVGEKIIYSLLRFNLPASDENILTLYKNIQFIDKLKDMSNEEFLKYFTEKVHPGLSPESKELKTALNIFNVLKNTDMDFLSFLVENKISPNVDNIYKSSNMLKDNFLLNDLLDTIISSNKELGKDNYKVHKIQDSSNLKNSNSTVIIEKYPELENTDFKKNISFSDEIISINKNILSTTTTNELVPPKALKLESLLLTLKNLLSKMPILDKEVIINCAKKLNLQIKEINTMEDLIEHLNLNDNAGGIASMDKYIKLMDNSEIVNHILNNYLIYNFNADILNQKYKNALIIKNKYKGSKLSASDDIKAFITVDASNIGLVEGYIHKKNMDLVILIKTNELYLNLFKNNLNILQNNLLVQGFSSVNISIDKLKDEKNIISLSNFFNDYGFQELDVKI